LAPAAQNLGVGLRQRCHHDLLERDGVKKDAPVSHAEAAILRSAYSVFFWIPPVVRRLFEVNSEPHTGHVPRSACVWG